MKLKRYGDASLLGVLPRDFTFYGNADGLFERLDTLKDFEQPLISSSHDFMRDIPD